MGAKFAPSLANLFMALWEDRNIYSHRTKELIFWRRYIDDALFIWKGNAYTLEKFMTNLNCNDWGIRFSYQFSSESVNYLDLVITRKGNSFSTKSYLKPTDKNGFIPIDSCHHPTWLKSVPKGQFKRIRRNCTED